MDEHTFDTPTPLPKTVSTMDSVVGLTGLLDDHRLVRLEEIAALDRSGAYSPDGYTSVSAFLIHRCGLSGREANREVFLARSLGEMPGAKNAVLSGDLTISQLEILAYARRHHPKAYAVDEDTLVGAVAGLTRSDTRRAVQYWTNLHDELTGDDPDEGPSEVWLSKTWRGRWRLDGDLDPETGSLLHTAFDQLMSQVVDATPKEELASAPQRRGEALSELARRFLDSSEAPTDHGNRPHLTAIVDWNTLTGNQPGGMSELLDGTVLTAAHARRLACDAHLSRLLTGPDGEILDLGRSRRTVTVAQWKALRIRDRHCQFRGCYRPWTWCDAHHIDPWTEQEGPSDLANLILMCRHHHTLIHQGQWKLTGTPQHLTITRPDGTILNNGPP